jgi:flagellar hook-associated protein 3 FlgL
MMRVTSNTFTSQIIAGSQSAQSLLANLQQEISTGNDIQNPSDDPIAYSEATQTQQSLDQLSTYSAAATQASTLATQNNQAMTSLHQIIAQAGELLASVSSNMSPSDLKDVGTQMSSLVSQLTTVANQTYNGNYLFGGTSNQPPINASTQTYNSQANGDTTSIEVQPGNSVQTGIVAGQPGPPAVDGFLYDSSTGTDVLASLKQAVADLNSGNVTAVQGTDTTAINNSLTLLSTYVGSTASDIGAAQTAGDQISQQMVTQQDSLNGLTQTNLPNAEIQLQQLQNQYEATLEAGTRIMNLSIMNYLSAVSTT